MKKYIFLLSTILLGGIVLIFILIKEDANDVDIASSIYINEVMASNAETIMDESGKYPDWIELYNGSEIDLNIGNYYLTDREDNLVKWRFTRDIIIPAKGYLLVWASGKNEIHNNQDIHTNFKISAEGETILLVAPNGETIIDSVDTNRMGNDVSVGRLPDGSKGWKTFYAATPEESNVLSDEFVENPKFSKPGGFYKEKFSLSIDAEPDSDVYYTLDGSEPGENDLLYEEPIVIDSRKGEGNELSLLRTSSTTWLGPPEEEVFRGTVVNAIVIKNGKRSDVITNTYFVDEAIDERYQIPVVSITTDQANLFEQETGLFVNKNYLNRGREWERKGYIEFFDEDGQLGFRDEIGIRIHGNYSRNWPNPPIRIYARGKEGYINYQLFEDKPVDAFNTFLLRSGGSAYSKAMFRDPLLQDLVKDLGHFDVQYSKPSILFINGEYWGIYNIRDRFDDDYIYNHYGTKNIDVISDRIEPDYGSTEDFEKLQRLLQKDLNQGMNYDFVKEQMDITNFADYHITQIFYMNIDQPWRNIKIWKVKEPFDSEYEETDGRWRWLLYDTEQSFSYEDFASYERSGLEFSTNLDYFGAPSVNPQSEWPTYAANRPIATLPLRALLTSDEFRVYFINRFADLLNTTFTSANIVPKIEEMNQLYLPYVEEHINRWGRPSSVEAWNEDVEKMIEFSKMRPEYMTQDIVDYFGLSGTYQLSIMNDSNYGKIKLNTLDVNEEFSGTYFNNIPIELEAQAKKGYHFVKWVSDHEEINNSDNRLIKVVIKEDTTVSAVYKLGDEPEVKQPADQESELNPTVPLIIATAIVSSFLIGYVFSQKIKN